MKLFYFAILAGMSPVLARASGTELCSLYIKGYQCIGGDMYLECPENECNKDSCCQNGPVEHCLDFDPTKCVYDLNDVDCSSGECNISTCCGDRPDGSSGDTGNTFGSCADFDSSQCSWGKLTDSECGTGGCDVKTCCKEGPVKLCADFDSSQCSWGKLTDSECGTGGCDVKTCCKTSTYKDHKKKNGKSKGYKKGYKKGGRSKSRRHKGHKW